MNISSKIKDNISRILKDAVLGKLENYNPETKYKPFHHRLLGKDRYAMFSFIQSMNTTFGMSVWEQVSVELANNSDYDAERQYKLNGEINREAKMVIDEIHTDLRKGDIEADKFKEIERIRDKIIRGASKKDPDSTVDLYIRIDDEDNYFDITSVKPNKKEFEELKRKLLNWTALGLSQNSDANIITRLAIPYNPYYPDKYDRWTLKGMYDLKNEEILIGREFWNFIAGEDIYKELLDIFQTVGEELREKIDEKFAKFK